MEQMLTEVVDRERKLYSERHVIAFPRSSFTIISTILEYSLPVSGSQSFLK